MNNKINLGFIELSSLEVALSILLIGSVIGSIIYSLV